MFDEPFSQGNSLLHSLDPRVKCASALVFSCVVAVAGSYSAAAAGLLVALGLVFAARPDVRPLARRLVQMNCFVLFLWIMLPLTFPGETAATLGPVVLTRPGLELALLITLKSNAILLGFIALISTTDAATLGHALFSMGAPPRLVFLFLFTYRYVHVIEQEYTRLATAARLRGFVPRTNLHTYRTAGNLLGMVLVRSLDRSQRVYEAMLLRGYCGTFHSLREFRLTRKDLLFSFTLLLLVAMLIWLECRPGGFCG